MTVTDALVTAGYTPKSANSEGYRIIRHPEIQSKLTQAVERVLAQEQAEFDEIVRPYIKALKAKVVVKNSQTLMAAETEIPDHAVRMEAAAHITKLYQPKNVEEDDEKERSGPPVLYQINFIEAGAKAPAPVIVSSPSPVPPTGTSPPVPQVAFVSRKR